MEIKIYLEEMNVFDVFINNFKKKMLAIFEK